MSFAIAFAPDGKTAYVEGMGTVTPVNLATNTPGKPISVRGVRGEAIGVTPDGKTVYVGTQERIGTSNTEAVVPISTATNTAGKPIPVGQVVYMGMPPGGKTLYAAGLGPDPTLPHRHDRVRIVPISTTTNTPGKPIHLPIRVGIGNGVIVP